MRDSTVLPPSLPCQIALMSSRLFLHLEKAILGPDERFDFAGPTVLLIPFVSFNKSKFIP